MKNYFSLIALMMALVSCQTEKLVEETTTSNVVYQAYTDADENTKTSMDQDFNVIWSEGDEVSIFEGSAVNQKYRTKTFGSTSTEMEFVGGSSFVAGTEIASNVAVYPYSSELSIKKSGDKYTVGNVVFPEAQMYAESSFGKGVAPMVAVTSSTSDKVLKFKNAFGGVNLQLVGTDKIKSITLSGNNGEVICGAANVSVSNAVVPEVTMTGTGTSITLECGEGVQLNESTPTSFYIVLPPVAMANGFTAIVTDTEGKTMTMSSSKAQTISRNTMLNMPEKKYEKDRKPLTFTATQPNSKVALVKRGNPADVPQEYSFDGKQWYNYDFGTGILLDEIGKSVSFRKRNEGLAEEFSGENFSNYYVFVAIGEIEASGTVMSLIDKTCKTVRIPSDYCFHSLFEGCNALIKAPELTATTLTEDCYYYMFKDCSSLHTAPELPARTLSTSCYFGMFHNCTSLTAAPELPATTLASYCYESMFFGCTSLVNAPDLPATTLADDCYRGMFNRCTNLTNAPELPAEVLAQRCYLDMFRGCSSLETPPIIRATELADDCYAYMFMDCISLKTAPLLPVKTLTPGCYFHMFYGCRELSSVIYLPAKILVSQCYSYMFTNCKKLYEIHCDAVGDPYCALYWMKGCSSYGNFYANPSCEWHMYQDDSQIKTGWNIIYDL